MNIFYLDNNQRKCAEYHCDKHVVKMILESAQLLSAAIHLNMGELAPSSIYKLTHKNHPCTKWVSASRSNYLWLCELMSELGREYTIRYRKVHKSMGLYDTFLHYANFIPESGFSEPPRCMPDEYKLGSVVDSYRNYYRHGKKDLLTYKLLEPNWL